MDIPGFATHYYLSSRAPFQTLTALDDDAANAVMSKLNEERRNGVHHRLFGKVYLRMRREAERRLAEGLLLAGGRVERQSPYYLVIGESAWFRGLSPTMREVRVPVGSLPSLLTSITYGDSFYATGVSAEYGFGVAPAEAHSKVYLLSDLPRLINDLGLPVDDTEADYDGYEHRTAVRFIEVQVWSDDVAAWMP